MGSLAYREGGRSPGTHADERARVPQPLISRVGRIAERGAARIVVREYGGPEVGRGRTHPVEQGKVAVPMTEEAQHGHHAVDSVEERRGRRKVAGAKCRAEWQEINENWDQGARAAADVTPIGEDLPAELLCEPGCGRAHVALLSRH